ARSAAAGQGLAVRAIRQGTAGPPILPEGRPLFARLDVPPVHHPTPMGSGQRFPVRTERQQIIGASEIVGQRGPTWTAALVPQATCAGVFLDEIPAAACEVLAVRAKRYSGNFPVAWLQDRP